MGLPLAGVSIVEAYSQGAPPALAVAVGFCGRVAADLGASVTRLLPPGCDDDAASFLHAGKPVLRGQADSTSLAEADAVVVDIGLQDTAGLPPIRAVLSMDGTGDPRQSEFTIEARAGLLHIVGDPDREPLRLGGHQTAYAAGLAAFTALTGALLGPPGPTTIQVSLLETALWLNWKSLAVAQQTGTSLARSGANAEWPVLRCADGYVVLVYRKQEWSRLLEAFPDPALQDERLQTPEGRRARRAEINAILQRLVAPLTRAALHALSLRHKLPFGPVWRPDELPGDAQMQARNFFAPIPGGVRPLTPVLWNGVRLAAQA